MVEIKKGRSKYSFKMTCDNDTINKLIQDYLNANDFKLVSKNKEEFYRAGDAFVQGYRGFAYYFEGSKLNITVWLIGILGGEYILEQNALNMSAMNYRNSLNSLFKQISNLNKGDVNNGQWK